MYEPIREALFCARRAAICAHVNPDGDAIGSALALQLALNARGVEAAVLLAQAPGQEYAFLPGVDGVVLPQAESFCDDFDLVVCLDCADSGRLGPWQFLLEKTGRPVVVIDHHVTNAGFGDFSCIRPEAAATGQILTSLFLDWGVAIDARIALCLYTAISTDTGGFAFSNTREETLQCAAALVARGADVALVYQKVYATRSLAKTRLIARALGSLRTYCGGKVITGVLDAADFAACGAQQSDTEGIINFLRDVEGCVACALLRDAEGGGCKVSLRCAEDCDVAAVAARFGGGGHRAAAGCSLAVRAHEAERLLAAALTACVEEKDVP